MGFRTSVNPAVISATMREANRTGRNNRSALTPAARKATISRSLASRPPAEHREQQAQRKRHRHERRQHEDEELDDEMEGHALGDDEVGEL